MTCTRCGTPVREGAAFCKQCGASTAPAPAANATLHGRETVVPLDDRPGAADVLEPGARFADRYEILSLLGKGGMGVVYTARDTATGRDLVLKLIRPERLRGEAAVQQLLTEGVTAQQIRHRNVVAVYDVAQWQGQPYFTMEYVKGGSLRSFMVAQKQKRQDVPLPVAAGIVRAMLAGLGEAHRLGIVHRDLKPENVLLAGDPLAGDFNLKVVDFGLAHMAGEGRIDGGGFAGTLRYMAPEQEQAADTVDATADIYSVAVIFYELLMENAPQVRWEPVSRHRRDVPPALDALLEQSLSARPRSRPASVEAFGAALDAALAEGRAPDPRPDPTPVPDPPPPPPPAESFVARLTRQWAGLSGGQKAAIVGVSLAVGIAANWPTPSPAPDPAPCNPAIEDCGGDVDPDPTPDPGPAPQPPQPDPGPAPSPRPVPPRSDDPFAAGSWRDGAGNVFAAEHDGVNVRAQGIIAGVGPVVITGTVTRAQGASLVVTTAAGQPMYGGTGRVAQGNGGLDINLSFVYPNRQPAGQTTIHINH